MRRFFDPESLLWKPLGFLGEIVTLSLLWTLCSIPLVTIGTASAALSASMYASMCSSQLPHSLGL